MEISPSQALLLIIDYIKKQSTIDTIEYNNLIHLYLDGVINPDYLAYMNYYFTQYEETALRGCVINFDKKIINDDPTRRYFETHLSFESLSLGLKHVSKHHLQWLEHNIIGALNRIGTPKGAAKSSRAPIYEFREGKYYKGTILVDNKQYYEYLHRIKEPLSEKAIGNDEDILFNKPPYTKEDRDKVRLIIRCTMLSLIWANSKTKSKHLPLDIYNQGLFTPAQRGRLTKVGNERSLTQNYGLMKAYMPLARDDLALAKRPFNFFKPSEKCTYIDGSDWVDINFYRAVHPFSSSISGTALCLLKTVAYFRNIPSTAQKENKLYLTKAKSEFDHFFRSFVATHLCFSGGHSLFEFTHVLNLPEVARSFSSKEGRKETDLDLASATISRLFMFDDNQALVNALNKTIEYNHRYLAQKKIQASILQISNLATFFRPEKQGVTLQNQWLLGLKIKSIPRLKPEYRGSRWFHNIEDDNWSNNKKRKEIAKEASEDMEKTSLAPIEEEAEVLEVTVKKNKVHKSL